MGHGGLAAAGSAQASGAHSQRLTKSYDPVQQKETERQTSQSCQKVEPEMIIL